MIAYAICSKSVCKAKLWIAGAYCGATKAFEKQGANLDIDYSGLYMGICIATNALIVRSHFPKASLAAHEMCCAGVTPVDTRRLVHFERIPCKLHLAHQTENARECSHSC